MADASIRPAGLAVAAAWFAALLAAACTGCATSPARPSVPSPALFADPTPWTGVPHNGTVNWSGAWRGSDGSDWDVSVTWTVDAQGGYDLTAFTAKLEDSPPR